MRVLVVEDEARIAQAIKRSLESQSYAVDTVGDSDSGYSHGSDPDYDILLLDRMLPGSMDGLTVCKRLRADHIDTPILLLTALSDVNNRVEGLRAGADDYLVKPFSMAELIARVQALLRRPRKTVGAEVRVADLEIHMETFEVIRDGKLINLSAREFKLLRYLAFNLGQTVTKEAIISHVWNGDANIMPNTVEVYIGYLRRKIDKAFPGKTQLIHTVRGFGYRLGGRVV